ncbi:hypothetical protein CDAR_303471 [Caerostris darwini]|uniref:Maturase K n=1 Tax=Caerostris darwini TaxID=1538125 RepID=A0AAV4S7T9_9ARAC|nr:hypothetical protein CDAR_303471 [Caerostris darwini]
MPPISLYETCLDRIIELIQVEHWGEEHENPFSRLPPKIVKLLVEVCGTSQEFRKFSYFRMSLSSGKLRKLKLCFPVIFINICRVLPQILTEKGCLNITVSSQALSIMMRVNGWKTCFRSSLYWRSSLHEQYLTRKH